MNLRPRGLDIPLHPREWFWAKALAAIILVGLALVLFLPRFGIAYSATTVVVLPVLAPYLLSRTVVERIGHAGWPVKVFAIGAILVYLKFARSTFAPVVMNWLAELVL